MPLSCDLVRKQDLGNWSIFTPIAPTHLECAQDVGVSPAKSIARCLMATGGQDFDSTSFTDCSIKERLVSLLCWDYP